MSSRDFTGVYATDIKQHNLTENTQLNQTGEIIIALFTQGAGLVELDSVSEEYNKASRIFTDKAFIVTPRKDTVLTVIRLGNAKNLKNHGLYRSKDSFGDSFFINTVAADLADDIKDIENHSVKMYKYIIELDKASPTGSSALVEGALESIHSDFASIEGIDELAENIGVTKSHLIREFKKHTRTTPGKYLEKIRIERAVVLMNYTNYSLEIIANMVGFSSANYYCRVFRKSTGQSPNNFRKQGKKIGLTPAGKKIIEQIESTYLV